MPPAAATLLDAAARRHPLNWRRHVRSLDDEAARGDVGVEEVEEVDDLAEFVLNLDVCRKNMDK